MRELSGLRTPGAWTRCTVLASRAKLKDYGFLEGLRTWSTEEFCGGWVQRDVGAHVGRPLRVARVSRPSLSPDEVGPTFSGRFVALAVCTVRSGGWRDPAAVGVHSSWPSLRTVHFGVGTSFISV